MIIFDLECNGLLNELDKIWCAVTKDLETGEEKIFSDYSEAIVDGDTFDFIEYLSRQDKICGHNIIAYDLPAIKMVTGFAYEGEVIDTLLLSQLLHFTRLTPKGTHTKHSLEAWGLRLGVAKPKQEQWVEWEENMLHRCLEDVKINVLTYERLLEEISQQPDIDRSIKTEHEVAHISRAQVENGWLLDMDKIDSNIEYLDAKIESIRSEVEPQIPAVVKQKDPKMDWGGVNKLFKEQGYKGWKKVPKTMLDHIQRPIKLSYKPIFPKILKSGCYDKWTALWFGIPPENSLGERKILGPYTRIEFQPVKLAQHKLVKDYLLKYQNWRPTQWTFKKDRDGKVLRDDKGRPMKNSPQLSEDSYHTIKGEIGNLISTHATLVHRRNTLANPGDDTKGWKNLAREDGRISCEPSTLGAATGRMTHRNLVNVPGTRSLFGKEMRQCFVAADRKILIGADAAGAQLRLLASAMEDEDYVRIVVEGAEEDKSGTFIGTDVHTQNGIAAGLIKQDDVDWLRSNTRDHPDYGKVHDRFVGCRGKSKNFIYGLLFGAGNAKMGILVDGNERDGKRLKESFLKGFPKLQELIDNLTIQYDESKSKYKEGFIYGADNRRIYVSSPHKVLNYLLQGNEAIYMKNVMTMVDRLVRKNKVRADLLCFYHDELNFEVHPDDAGKMSKILVHSFEKVGESLELVCPMATEPKTGNTWYDIH